MQLKFNLLSSLTSVTNIPVKKRSITTKHGQTITSVIQIWSEDDVRQSSFRPKSVFDPHFPLMHDLNSHRLYVNQY